MKRENGLQGFRIKFSKVAYFLLEQTNRKLDFPMNVSSPCNFWNQIICNIAGEIQDQEITRIREESKKINCKATSSLISVP